jgi:hypothetical protein
MSVLFTTMISVSHCSQRNLVPAAVGMQRRIPNDADLAASRAPERDGGRDQDSPAGRAVRRARARALVG